MIDLCENLPTISVYSFTKEKHIGKYNNRRKLRDMVPITSALDRWRNINCQENKYSLDFIDLKNNNNKKKKKNLD